MQELEYQLVMFTADIALMNIRTTSITIMSLVKAKRLRIPIPQDLDTANIKQD